MTERISYDPKDFTPEVAAAYERYQHAGEVLRAHTIEHSKLTEAFLAASDEFLTLSKRAQPLPALLIDALNRIMFRGGPATAKQLAKYVRRDDLAEVQACLDDLVADGRVRRAQRRRGDSGYALVGAA